MERAQEGFKTSDGRLVYSIIFTLECAAPRSLQHIVSLDCNGNCRNNITRAADYTKRIVDVWPGSQIRVKGQKHKVLSVDAYRWTENGVAHGWPES